MKKPLLITATLLFISLAAASQPPLKGRIVTLTYGQDTVGGVYISDTYILSRYRPVSRMKNPAVHCNDTSFKSVVQGYVSVMPEQDLVLLKATSCNGRFFGLNKDGCPENREVYLFLDDHIILKGSCGTTRDFGSFALLTLSGLPAGAPDGLPLTDENGLLVAMSVPRPDESIEALFSVPASRILTLLEQAGTVKTLDMLTPVFENISEAEYKTQNDKNKAVEEYLNQGNLKLYYKDYKAAAEKFSMAIKINPVDADAYVFRGQARYYLMQYKDAIDDFSKAIDLEPGYAEAWDLRGICKAELGDKKGACDDWQRAYELGFTHAFKLLKEFCDIDKIK